MFFNFISTIFFFLACYLREIVVLSATTTDFGDEVAPHLRGKRSLVQIDGVEHTVWEHDATHAKIDFVTNSGVCETTRGVDQYSGYVDVGNNQRMWFWFFEARNKPQKAPLALWLNGGPGCSSMLGLFKENGPCQFVGNDPTPTPNPYSWNEFANMLYVDQPIGVGFSYGKNDVSSSIQAAPLVWTLLQAFFAHFPKYENRDFGLFTESYGGHYGPEFSSYINDQNAAITKKTLNAEPINLIAMGINNGWYDAYTQTLQYPSYAANNTYRPLLNASEAARYLQDISKECLPETKKCNTLVGKNDICVHAQQVCESIDGNYNYPDVDFYDIRHPGPGDFPGTAYADYLNDPKIKKKIGAKSNYVQCSDEAKGLFDGTGDSSRSFIPTLSSLISSGLPTLIWAGDSDAVCDWFGAYAVVNQISYPQASTFRNTKVSEYKTNGMVKGEFKSVGKLSWLRVFQCGHTIMSEQPEMSLQVFRQMMEKGGLKST